MTCRVVLVVVQSTVHLALWRASETDFTPPSWAQCDVCSPQCSVYSAFCKVKAHQYNQRPEAHREMLSLKHCLFQACDETLQGSGPIRNHSCACSDMNCKLRASSAPYGKCRTIINFYRLVTTAVLGAMFCCCLAYFSHAQMSLQLMNMCGACSMRHSVCFDSGFIGMKFACSRSDSCLGGRQPRPQKPAWDQR